MSKIKLTGHASGSGVLTIAAPNTDSDRTITLPDVTGTLLDSGSDLPAANLTGTVADARISALTASKLTGALPAISGASLTNLPSDITVATSAPGSPSAGDLWFNSSNATVSGVFAKCVGVYNGTDWDQLSNIIFEPTGGTQTTYSGYKVATFTSSGTFTPNISGDIDVLVVGGGAGGGSGRGGGGGAGGMVFRTGFSVTAQAYTITIGAGGSGSTQHNSDPPSNGGDTTAFSVTAKGGGAAGSGVTGTTSVSIGKTGGCGGGTTHGADGNIASNQGTFSGWTSKGYAGGNGNGSDNESAGGGGGCGAQGQDGDAAGNGGDGGIGFQNDYQTGSNQYYGGGGGGGFGADIGATSGNGGNGGGGRGAAGASNTPTGDAIAGTANTGGGGGGGCYTGSFGLTSNQGKDGGSGIVVIRWAV
jgi:hypothetical protein